MTFSDSKINLNLPIYEQAADWLIELREGNVDAATRERLDAWFRASPEHIRAYLELSSLWEEGADPNLDRTHTTEDLIARARATSNVIPLSAVGIEPRESTAESTSQPPETLAASQASSTSERDSETSMRQLREDSPDRRHGVYGSFWRRQPFWIAAAVSACVVGSLGGLYVYGERNRTIATETGEQRFVGLVDGSTLVLNSRSSVRIRFSDSERDVDLIGGQALFHVAHDASRPFIVHSGTTLVRAVGTQFDVYRKESGTTVTVVEGRVAVLSPMLERTPDSGPSGNSAPLKVQPAGPSTHTPLSGQGQGTESGPLAIQKPQLSADAVLSNAQNAIYLAAGEQITVSAGAPPRATHADPTVATAWTQHELVFDSTPLEEVAQDFNRYNTRQLIIKDPALTNFHITGVFSSSDPASLLKFLRAQHDIKVEETDDGIRVSKK